MKRPAPESARQKWIKRVVPTLEKAFPELSEVAEGKFSEADPLKREVILVACKLVQSLILEQAGVK